MYRILRHGHGLQNIFRGIVELVLRRDLICVNSGLVVGYIERHSVEELSENVVETFTSFCATRQADVSWQCRFTTGAALNLRQHADEHFDE